MSAREELHLTDEQLDDYADGVMSEVERGRVEVHLAVCDWCRRSVHDTRELLARATNERAPVTAPAELWPLVASQTIHLAAVRRAVLRSMRGVLVIGAIVLVAATAAITWRVARWSSRPETAPSRVESSPRGGTHAGHPRGSTAPPAPRAPRAPDPPRP